ncbi:hypothetical protein MMC26_002834 [Xylographa opegraphella]|nr:hypothetical protein [Xylographa opegraphella]
MPSRGRPRGTSQSNINTVSGSQIRRSSTLRGPRATLSTQRRSTRLSNLFAASEGELPSISDTSGTQVTEASSQSCALIPEQQNEEPTGIERPQTHIVEDEFDQHLEDQTSRQHQVILTEEDYLMNGIVLQTDNSYTMRIIIEPPLRARPGEVLTPPLVMSLENDSGTNSPAREPVDPALLWAVVSVVSEDDRTPLAPPRTDLLRGTIADSVHPLTPPDHAGQIGLVAFPNLIIREPGRYRLRVSLIKMNAVGATRTPSYEGGTAVQSMSSRVIDVAPTAEALVPGLGLLTYSIRTELTEIRKRRAKLVGSFATAWITVGALSMLDLEHEAGNTFGFHEI